MPCIDNNIETPIKATIFSSLDASSGYWWAKADQKGLSIAPFMSYNRQFKLIRMSLELKNVAGTLQLATNVILVLAKWQMFPVCLVKDIGFLG